MRGELVVIMAGLFFCEAVPAVELAHCAPAMSVHIEARIHTVRGWPDIYTIYQNNVACNGEGVVEVWTAYSGLISKMLADQWSNFEQFADLALRHPKFSAFVLKHLADETIPEDTLRKVRINAEKFCPAEQSQLCYAVLRAAR